MFSEEYVWIILGHCVLNHYDRKWQRIISMDEGQRTTDPMKKQSNNIWRVRETYIVLRVLRIVSIHRYATLFGLLKYLTRGGTRWFLTKRSMGKAIAQLRGFRKRNKRRIVLSWWRVKSVTISFSVVAEVSSILKLTVGRGDQTTKETLIQYTVVILHSDVVGVHSGFRVRR